MILFLIILFLFLVVIAGFAFVIDSNAKKMAESRPRLRACPLCGKELQLGENILAERTGVMKEGRERIVIKGCPFCVKKTEAGASALLAGKM